MRIMLTTNVRPAPGGVGSHINTLATALRRLGCQLDVVSVLGLTREFRTIESKMLAGSRFIISRPWGFLGAYYLAGRLLLTKIGRAVRHNRYDIIHAHDVCAANQAHKLTSVLGVPLILTVHGYLAREALSSGNIVRGGSAERYLLHEEKAAYRSADYVLTVDRNLYSYVQSFGVDPKRIFVIGNFVDTTIFSPGEGPVRVPERNGVTILCPRRLVKKNGVIYAVLAVKELVFKYGLKVRLIVAGDGPERSPIERCVRENGMDNVVLLGDVQGHQMVDLYRSADVVIVPSIAIEGVVEATSIAVLEAMACGVPVVASNIGGLAELIEDGETGLLVPEKSPEAIAKCVDMLMKFVELRQRILENALRTVQRLYSEQAFVTKQLKVYELAMTQSKTG